MTPRFAAGLAALTFAFAPAVSGQDDPIDSFFVGADTEKAQLAAFKKVYRGKDMKVLGEAITAFGEASRALEDGGSSKSVAKAIARGIDEDSFEAQTAAVIELSWGREPGVVLDLFEDLLDDTRNEIQKRLGRPDQESRIERNDATELFALICTALSNHRDDRAVDALESQMRQIAQGSKGNNLAGGLITPLSDALLKLRQRDGVEAVVKTTGMFTGTNQTANAKRLHTALSKCSDELGYAPPAFDKKFDQSWRDWFDAHEDEFPKKLGKLDGPIERPADYGRKPRNMAGRSTDAPKRP